MVPLLREYSGLYRASFLGLGIEKYRYPATGTEMLASGRPLSPNSCAIVLRSRSATVGGAATPTPTATLAVVYPVYFRRLTTRGVGGCPRLIPNTCSSRHSNIGGVFFL